MPLYAVSVLVLFHVQFLSLFFHFKALKKSMAAAFCHSRTLPLFFSFFLLLVLSTYSLQFQKPRFDPDDAEIIYLGDAKPSVGAIALNSHYTYTCQAGWATYAEEVLLWDSITGKLTDFSTHYSFYINTQGNSKYAAGMAFFLAPVEFQIPPNSGGGFLGLFNVTTTDLSRNQIVHVEFDTYSNPEWDPPGEHVGINNNSLHSEVYTSWNASLHSDDTVHVWIMYNATTKNLSVTWTYDSTSTPAESTSLSYLIDLKEVLPERVKIGFSAATGIYLERHTLLSWEFNSTLEESGDVRGSKKTRLTLILSTVLGGVLIVGAIAAFAIIWRWKRHKKKTAEEFNLTSINDDIERGAGPRKFSYKELASATNNFSIARKLGQGGFGAVYRGYFVDLDLVVAVKKISRSSRQGRREYVTEVKVISSLRHRNLVQLIGWCHEKGVFLLVYEFMPNGSLDSHLFGNKSFLSWKVRHKIALGLASAVLYLHEEWEQCVIHRDIKSSNVMLDSNFNVKLGDFGLAKLMDHELGPQTTGLAGTPGYLAPEYISTRRASKESDVFSFGIVALEIATGRKANDLMEDKDGEKGLAEWVWDLYGKGEIIKAMNERLQTDFDAKQVECLMVVGLWCAHPDRNLRPAIRQAIHVLKFEATMPILPPKMPFPLYHVPTPSLCSGEADITTSIQMGR